MVGLGKRFFQMPWDDRGKKLLNGRMRRDQIVPLPRCSVAMETCAGA